MFGSQLASSTAYFFSLFSLHDQRALGLIGTTLGGRFAFWPASPQMCAASARAGARWALGSVPYHVLRARSRGGTQTFNCELRVLAATVQPLEKKPLGCDPCNGSLARVGRGLCASSETALLVQPLGRLRSPGAPPIHCRILLLLAVKSIFECSERLF